MSKKHDYQPTIITLTLPTPSDGGIPKGEDTATILIQRGDLAHVRQFRYVLLDDLYTAIREASESLGLLEDHPPVITDAPADMPKSQAAHNPPADTEPTIDIPLKKGTKTVKASYLQNTGGDTDEAAHHQALQIAGKLIDGGLWDGQSPIRIDDVATVAKKMECLTIKDLSLFTLDDFVQVDSL